MTVEQIAQESYISYITSLGREDQMPKWQDLPECIRIAWLVSTSKTLELSSQLTQ